MRLKPTNAQGLVLPFGVLIVHAILIIGMGTPPLAAAMLVIFCGLFAAWNLAVYRAHIRRISSDPRLAVPCILTFAGIRRHLRILSAVLLACTFLFTGGMLQVFAVVKGRSMLELPVRYRLCAWHPGPMVNQEKYTAGYYRVMGPNGEDSFGPSESPEAMEFIRMRRADPESTSVRHLTWEPVEGLDLILIGKLLPHYESDRPTEIIFEPVPDGSSFMYWAPLATLDWLLRYHGAGWLGCLWLLLCSAVAYGLSFCPPDAMKFLSVADEELEASVS